MNEELEKKIDGALEDLPEEVSEFMFQGDLDAVIEEVSSLLESPDEKKRIANDLTFFLLGTTTKDELDTLINTLTTSPEKKLQVQSIIQEKIINELEYRLSTEEEVIQNTSIEKSVSAPSPVEALAMIKDRLSKPNTITPTKRDYSNELVAEPTISEAPTGIKSVDPYRELPSE